MSLAHVDGVDLHYRVDDLSDPWRDRAEVKTVFLHHAFLRGLDSLAGWVPTLARHYRVVRIDARGFGGSSAPPVPFEMTMEQLAVDSAALLDDLGIDSVHFMGVSSGGIAGQILAATHPDRVKSLTLCDSPHRLNDAVKTRLSVGEASPSTAMRKLGFAAWRQATMDSTLDPNAVHRRMTEWQVEQQNRVPLHISASTEQSLENADTAELLPRISCPALLLGGDRSVFVPLEMQLFMARQIPNSRVQVFPNIGSTLSITQSAMCSAAMLAFIQEVDAQ